MRRSFCMFLIFILTLMLLSLDFSFAAGEEAGMPVPGDDHPSEEIVRAGENRGRFSVMTEKQRMTYIVPGDEYGENSKSSGRQRDLPCDAAGITGKGYSKTTRNAYGEPSPVHLESTAAFNFLSNIRAIPFSDIPARCIRMTSWKRRWM